MRRGVTAVLVLLALVGISRAQFPTDQTEPPTIRWNRYDDGREQDVRDRDRDRDKVEFRDRDRDRERGEFGNSGSTRDWDSINRDTSSRDRDSSFGLGYRPTNQQNENVIIKEA